jgi:hypothetical protein
MPPAVKAAEDAVREETATPADKAMEGLAKLFGAKPIKRATMAVPREPKPGEFNEDTWKRAKPMFEQAASKFKEFANNVNEALQKPTLSSHASGRANYCGK